MQPNDDPGEPNEGKSRLRRLIRGAFDAAGYAPDVPIATVDFIAETIVKRAPTVDQVADIVGEALRATGEGAGQAAELAGKVAEAIGEGLSGALSS
jgi:hypothetical protein